MELSAITLIGIFLLFAWLLKILRKENLKLEKELIQLQDENKKLTISNKELLNANYKLSKKILLTR